MKDNLMRRSHTHFSLGIAGKEPLSKKRKKTVLMSVSSTAELLSFLLLSYHQTVEDAVSFLLIRTK